MINPLEKDHLLSIDNTRAYIDTNIPCLEVLMINLPAVKEDTIMNKRLTKGKEKCKGWQFDRYKVQMEIICDGCNSHRCIYSNKMVGAKDGTTKYDVEELQKWSSGGYMCGSKVIGEIFYVQRKLFFGDSFTCML